MTTDTFPPPNAFKQRAFITHHVDKDLFTATVYLSDGNFGGSAAFPSYEECEQWLLDANPVIKITPRWVGL